MATQQQFTLTAESRQALGTAHSRRLRRLEDKIPGIVYGGDEAPHPITLDHKKVTKALENEGIYSHILTLHIDGKPQKTILKALHRHPYKAKILHMDFLRITGKEKIHMHIPIHFKGNEEAPGVKLGGGVMSHMMIEVEVECFPDHLPEAIEVDVSQLELDQTIHLSQIKIPKGVEIVALAHGNDMPVVTIHIPRVQPEPEPVVAEEAVTEEMAAAEGAEGTEGAEKTTPVEEGKKKE